MKTMKLDLSGQLNKAHVDLKQTIFTALGSRGAYTRQDIVAESGLHRNTLARFLAGGNLSIDTLLWLAVVIDCLEWEHDPARLIAEEKLKNRP
jgi:hypothetical protein